MNTTGTLNSKAKDHAADTLHRLSYATADKGRRQAPTSRLMAEDKHLNVSGRKKLIGTTRDLYRNFAPAAWAIRKHLDYTSTFSFQARTGDDAGGDRARGTGIWCFSTDPLSQGAQCYPTALLATVLLDCAGQTPYEGWQYYYYSATWLTG